MFYYERLGKELLIYDVEGELDARQTYRDLVNSEE